MTTEQAVELVRLAAAVLEGALSVVVKESGVDESLASHLLLTAHLVVLEAGERKRALSNAGLAADLFLDRERERQETSS